MCSDCGYVPAGPTPRPYGGCEAAFVLAACTMLSGKDLVLAQDRLTAYRNENAAEERLESHNRCYEETDRRARPQ
jgi:hypothetical protein